VLSNCRNGHKRTNVPSQRRKSDAKECRFVDTATEAKAGIAEPRRAKRNSRER